ncbi:MAG: hypothetical protein J2P17_34535, partial [Mycobacterium sp.]|nr:hypothetical protein [Mycobacterium sp.]
MSGRHRKSYRLPRNAELGGGIATVAAVGATAISMIAAASVNSSQKINAISAGAVAAAPHAVAASKPHTLALSGKGITTTVKKGERALLPTANDALKLAEAQVGITANASGGGTKFQNWFVSSPWAV